MNPLILLLPGAIIGLGLAIMILQYSPRVVRGGDVLTRLGEVALPDATAAQPLTGWEKAGAWIARHVPAVKYFSPPTRDLELIDCPVPRYYGLKLQYALIGLFAPILLSGIMQIGALVLQIPIGVTLPLVASPLLAAVLWIVPDGQVAREAKERRREFTRFTTVYLQLVAVSLLGNTTADSALMNAAKVSDSWVFRRIRREFQAADLTGTSKWDALERLGGSVGVPSLVDMARTMRLSEADVGLRNQLLASCELLRAQISADDKEAAERVTASMAAPAYTTLIPVFALLLAPPILQLVNM